MLYISIVEFSSKKKMIGKKRKIYMVQGLLEVNFLINKFTRLECFAMNYHEYAFLYRKLSLVRKRKYSCFIWQKLFCSISFGGFFCLQISNILKARPVWALTKCTDSTIQKIRISVEYSPQRHLSLSAYQKKI